MFIDEIVLPAANQFLLLECVPCSELVLAAELYCLQRGNSRYRIVLPAARQFSLLNFSMPVLASELCYLQRASFRCGIVLPAASQFDC